MAITDLAQLLKDAVMGNETEVGTAQQKLLLAFKENNISAEQAEEVHFYLKTMSVKQSQAIYLHALLYEYGYGIKADSSIAFLLMREAAAKGHSLAIYEVGHRFLVGQGVEKNYQNALQWLEIAATSPHYIRVAMLDLSRMYEEGLGIDVDQDKAKLWKEKAEQER